jgi:hypothetical protein
MEKIMYIDFYEAHTIVHKNDIVIVTMAKTNFCRMLSECKTLQQVMEWKEKWATKGSYLKSITKKQKCVFINDRIGMVSIEGDDVEVNALKGKTKGKDGIEFDLYLFAYKEKKDKEFEYVTTEEAQSILMELQDCSTDHAQEMLDEFVELKMMEKEDKKEEKEKERSIDQEFLYEKLKELKDFQDKMNDMYVFVEDTRDAVGELIDGFEFYIREQAKQ